MRREGRGGGNFRGDEEYVNMYRYAATLKKESKLDRDERAGVELSVVSVKVATPLERAEADNIC